MTHVNWKIVPWFEDFYYLGLALDVVHFRPAVGAQTVQTDQGGPLPLAKLDLEVFGLSIDLTLRYPLWRDEQLLMGRLQPYFLVGPLVGITTARDTTNFGPPNGQSHTSSPAGFNVGVGLLWALQRHVGLFAEYRYLAFHPGFQFEPAGKVDLHLNTYLLLGGVSVRF